MDLSPFDPRLAKLAARIDMLLPEGLGCRYDGEPPTIYYTRAVVTPRGDGCAAFFIESKDAWISELFRTSSDEDLRAAAVAQLQTVRWIDT